MSANRGAAEAATSSVHDAGHRLTGQVAERKRLPHLDDLKVWLVAVIIGGHAVIGYTTGDWTYQEVQETRIAPAYEAVFTFMLVPALLFAMGLFFLLAGLLAPGSLDRKGPRRFAGDRLQRLGVPWAAFALVLWPLTVAAMYRAVGASASLSWADLTEPPLDTGPLWFLVSCCCTRSATPPGRSLAPAARGRPATWAGAPAPRRAGCAAATWRRSPWGSRPRRSWSACGSRWAAPRSPTSSRGSGRSTWRCSASVF